MLPQDTKNMLYYTEQRGIKDALSFLPKAKHLVTRVAYHFVQTASYSVVELHCAISQ